MRLGKWLPVAGLAAGALSLIDVRPVAACGCFTPPDPTVPVVQAGERLLFALDGGQVTAHIQIQYAGAASEFGWLLPLPSPPTLELGSDEVFNDLITQTQPKYRLKRIYNGNCTFNNGFNTVQGGAAPNAEDRSDDPMMKQLVLVQSSVGPYDYAVLRADSKDDMLAWLAQNRYFVPAGTDGAVGPYIHPGAYFLALKLRPGQSVGDLQPVVVHYASDLPMIPIVLSSVAAQKDMGIQVWMLGAGRAIPRNYYHTVIDDAAVDWLTAGQNYNDVIIRASGEAPKHHTFVTEFAGSSAVMKDLLDGPGRFGSASELRAIADPGLYTLYMVQHGFPLSGAVISILGRYIPMPAGIAAAGITPQQYYGSLSYYLGPYRQQHPAVFERYDFSFDPAALTDELEARVVTPTLAAGELFRKQPYLTRLYTTLSPEFMTDDPVFSYNPDLPDVANVHEATLTYECGYFGSSQRDTTFAWLRTADGFTMSYGDGTRSSSVPNLPASRRIEVLREAGAPEVLTDNTSAIAGALSGSSGCSVSFRAAPRRAPALALALLALGGLAVARRRRSRA